MVPAHRAPRIRRHDTPFEGPQRKLRPPDREKLHPIPQTNHLATLRTADQTPLCRPQNLRNYGPRSGRCRYDRHFEVQHANQHGKYKKSVRNSRAQKDRHRPPAEPQPYVRYLHRGRVQPARPLGRHVRRRKPRKQPLQPLIYIWRLRTREDAHRAVHRTRSARAPSRIAGPLCLDEQVPGTVPDRIQER